jgi:hypothetical protein
VAVAVEVEEGELFNSISLGMWEEVDSGRQSPDASHGLDRVTLVTAPGLQGRKDRQMEQYIQPH